MKFGVLIDFNIVKQMPSLNLNPEVNFRLYIAASLEIRYDVTTPPPIVRLLLTLAGRCKMTCRWLHIHRNRNRK